MIELDHLRVFYHVGMHRTFAAAARYLNVSLNTVTRQMQKLEIDLGCSLMRRSAKLVKLTRQGEILFESAKRIVQEAQAIESKLSSKVRRERRELKILTTLGVVNLWMTRQIPDLIAKFPDYTFRVIGTDNELSLSEHFYELAPDIIIAQLGDGYEGLVCKKILVLHGGLFASQSYLDHFGTPKSFQDLDHHRLISFYSHGPHSMGNVDWHLTVDSSVPGGRKPFLTTNSAVSLYESASQGLGIISFPKEYPYLETGSLVPVLESLTENLLSFNIYMAYSKNHPDAEIFGNIANLISNK